MKILFCAMAFLILPLRLQAQESDKTKLEENVYYRALVAVLSARAQDAKYAPGNDPLHQVIIMRDIQLNIGFPSRVGDVNIEYVTEDDLRAWHRSLKHEIPIFVMRPISNEGNRLVIGFTRHWFSSTKKTNAMGLEGGYRVVMAYDCARKEYVVESAKLWGI
jgi:hypothetical protein